MVTRGKVQVMSDIKSVAIESKNLKKSLAPFNLAIKNAKTTTAQRAAKTALANEMARIKPIQKEVTNRWNALSKEYNKAFNNEPKTYAQAEDVVPGTQARRMAEQAAYELARDSKPKEKTITYSSLRRTSIPVITKIPIFSKHKPK